MSEKSLIAALKKIDADLFSSEDVNESVALRLRPLIEKTLANHNKNTYVVRGAWAYVFLFAFLWLIGAGVYQTLQVIF